MIRSIQCSAWIAPSLLFALIVPAQNNSKFKAGLMVAPDASGPSKANATTNVTVLRQWRRTTAGYSDVWGWTSPGGREFAYVGEQSGIWFLETTNSNSIKQIGWWSAPSSVWRDFTNYQQYVYSVSENHRGIRIHDMSNLNSPKDLGTVATSQITRTHNISADPETGYLYLSGTNQGLAIFDAKSNPKNPRFIGSWNGAYVHDACIRRGKAYLATGRSYACRIMNTSRSPILTEIGRANTPGGYCHNAWVSEDDQIMVCTDEAPRNGASAHLTVWDISSPARPVLRGHYDLGTTVHNAYIMGRTCYVSHYSEGFHMLDLADPSRPTMVAQLDTASAWGVYPFTDSGLVYVSDISNGFYVLRVTAGHMNRYEVGTVGSNGRIPKMKFDGATPRVGTSKLKLRIESMKPNAQGALLVAARKGKLNLLGVQVNVDLATMQIVRFQADSNGRAVLSAPVPNNAGLANTRVYMQIVAADSGNTNGFSASRGMWVGIAK